MSVFWWVELDFSSLACNEVLSSEFGVLAWLWAHCLLMLRVVFLLYCEGHPERFIESHRDEKREAGDRGDQEGTGGEESSQ